MDNGLLYLIPVPLGASDVSHSLPQGVINIVKSLTYFIVENEKTARRHLKQIHPQIDQSSLSLQVLNLNTPNEEIETMLKPCIQGHPVGLLSEAGCPAVADPGALVVRKCHELGIRVHPLIGPSSILLTLMASGLNGQRFAFHGYLPHDASERKKQLKLLERESMLHQQTQLFMETPYRNDKLLKELLEHLSMNTLLTVGVEMSLSTQEIYSRPIVEWLRKPIPSLHKRPSIFAILKEG